MMNTNRCGTNNNFGIDRISSLPDDPRKHILSFLSTREAVQTCILSKRWINTWASVPDLKFDIKEFGLLEIVDDEMVVQFVTKFKLLLRSVLEKRETLCVNIFQLWLDSDFCLPWTQAFANCIDDVMKLEPQECLVKLCSWEKLNLNTDLIFTCSSLIYLQLWLSTEVILELNSVNLPYLKTLDLDGLTMSDDSFNNLMLGCSVLEELVLENCYISNIEICSNTLKKLVLRSDYLGIILQISMPNLLYLYLDICMEEIILLNMSSLVDASIYIPSWYGEDKYVTRVPKLIHSLSNVESLWLDLDFLWGQCSIRESLGEETTQEGPRDAFVQREFLKTIRIERFENDNEFVDWLISKLLTHVKIIGEIIV